MIIELITIHRLEDQILVYPYSYLSEENNHSAFHQYYTDQKQDLFSMTMCY